jgi:hypothetical protein
MAGSGALVNKSESEKLTLNSLRRNDKTIEEIIETANHVSLYEFQLDTKAWVSCPNPDRPARSLFCGRAFQLPLFFLS